MHVFNLPLCLPVIKENIKLFDKQFLALRSTVMKISIFFARGTWKSQFSHVQCVRAIFVSHSCLIRCCKVSLDFLVLLLASAWLLKAYSLHH